MSRELHWIAGRVVAGQPVSVEVVMRELGACEPRAQELMAGPWSELMPGIEAEAATPPQRAANHERCPRCRAMLVERRPGHVWCVCGYSDEPADLRDKVVAIDPVECPLQPGQNRLRGTSTQPLPWTEEEREAWRAYDAGEPVASVEEWDRTRQWQVVKRREQARRRERLRMEGGQAS